jgi:hypothetical protein
MRPAMSTPQEDLRQIVASAGRLGVELDEAEALAWLSAMAAASAGAGDVTFDTETGVFGHRVTMLDFSPAELVRFREIGELVGFEDVPGSVETALALSGSAAQSRIQTYPGDCDFFERVNVIAPTREEACRTLGRIVREKALSTASGETHRLIEIKFGSYPEDVVRGEHEIGAGSPIAWTLDDVRARRIEVRRPDGTPLQILWDEVAADPGWCKLDWVVADPIRRRVANASNMLDVTWEAPDGTITPLDGYLDSYYQEVYLEASSIPIFSKLAREVLPDALDQYVEDLEGEIRRYADPEHANHGKVAKRMYNLFRLTGRYGEAAFIRELFDEPASVLYQVNALVRTVEEATDAASGISRETVIAQVDDLILAATRALEGQPEEVVVRHLLRLRDALAGDEDAQSEGVRAAQDEIGRIVNDFFRDRLMALPSIRAYLEELSSRAG